MSAVPPGDTNAVRRAALEIKVAESVDVKFPSVPALTPAALVALQQQGQPFIIVDVRTQEEYAVSHLPGSVTVEQFQAAKEGWRQRGARVVAYCTIGYRSAQFVETLKSKDGWNKAYNLTGSILAWVRAALNAFCGMFFPRRVCCAHPAPFLSAADADPRGAAIDDWSG